MTGEILVVEMPNVGFAHPVVRLQIGLETGGRLIGDIAVRADCDTRKWAIAWMVAVVRAPGGGERSQGLQIGHVGVVPLAVERPCRGRGYGRLRSAVRRPLRPNSQSAACDLPWVRKRTHLGPPYKQPKVAGITGSTDALEACCPFSKTSALGPARSRGQCSRVWTVSCPNQTARRGNLYRSRLHQATHGQSC